MKILVKLANIYDLLPLSVKWYCNSDRGSAGLLHHLHCNNLGNKYSSVPTVKTFRIESKTHKLTWHPSAEISSLLLTYIHYSLASFSELFKRKSLSFANLSLHGMALHGVVAWRFNILIGTSLYFAPNFQDQPWRCTCFGATFTAGIFLKKASLMDEDSFPIPLYCSLKYISLYFYP